MAFRSGLEEKVADLLVNLGVKYEYESTKVPYILQCNYTPRLSFAEWRLLRDKGSVDRGGPKEDESSESCESRVRYSLRLSSTL
jgi:hypothetical protein